MIISIFASMKYSVIIPTMWSSELIAQMLLIYEACDRIVEVIIIDNAKDKALEVDLYPKVVYLLQEKNIFVNPAWNLGVSKAKHTIILANDDILITELDELLDVCEASDYDLIGADIRNGNKELRQLINFPAQSFGCFLICKNYKYIPEQLKIWGGDSLQFDTAKSVAWVGGYITSPRSVTIKSGNFTEQCNKDNIEYRKLNVPYEFNIIIRTSNRPNYFKTCVDSIKRYLPNAKLHVTCDSAADKRYIAEYAPSANIYEIDRDKIQSICDKVPIVRPPFIYNEYLNVVLPFVKGWCMVLDDDDSLVSQPTFNRKDKDKFYIYKVNIGNGVIVPRTKEAIPTFRDISMIGLIFYAPDAERFTPQRGGDYQFALDMYYKKNPIFVQQVLSKSQTGGNMGKRNDKKVTGITINPYSNEQHYLSFPCHVTYQFEASKMEVTYQTEEEYNEHRLILKSIYG